VSKVLENPPAEPRSAREHFLSRLSFETDPSDVYTDLVNEVSGIVVVDARTPDSYARGHVPGAVNLPYRKIDASTTSFITKDKVVVTYCDGVFCNASTKGRCQTDGSRLSSQRNARRNGRLETRRLPRRRVGNVDNFRDLALRARNLPAGTLVFSFNLSEERLTMLALRENFVVSFVFPVGYGY
jgi:rhodanese-related sulfurtransferase